MNSPLKNMSLEEWHALSQEERSFLMEAYEQSDGPTFEALRFEYWALKNKRSSLFGMHCEELIASGKEYLVKRIFTEPTEAICLLQEVGGEWWKLQHDRKGNEIGIKSPPKNAVFELARKRRPDLFEFLGDPPGKKQMAKLWEQAGLEWIIRQGKGNEDDFRDMYKEAGLG